MKTTETILTHTPSGTPISTITAMEEQGRKAWQNYLKEIGSIPWSRK